MRNKLIVVVILSPAIVGGVVLGASYIKYLKYLKEKRANEERSRLIGIYQEAFELQMEEYEYDPLRRCDSIIFWKLVIGNDLI